MITIPANVVRGQAVSADTINEILVALRRCRPVLGTGILLQETMVGTVISAAQSSSGTETPFNHPFKVTLAQKADGTSSAKVLQGRFFTLAEGIATQVHFALEGLEATDGGWTADTCSYGDALYIKKTDDTYTLEWGTDTANALYIIASIEGDRYATPPRLEVKQHLLSDLYFLETAEGEMPDQNVFTPTATLTLSEPVEGDRYTEAKPPKLTLTIPYLNLKTGEVAKQVLEVDLLAVAKGMDGSDGEDGDDAELPEAQTLDVVTSVSYNASTHKLTYTKRTVTGYFTDLGTETTEEVFTATPHSGEHS